MDATDAVRERMPALYLSHGAPPLADDPVWPGQLAAWSAGLPRPKAILVVSAHWEEAPLALGATETVPLVYDFWGFPEHYYRSGTRPPARPRSPRASASCSARPARPCRTSPTGARPRRVRAARRDVPGRRRPRAPDLPAHPRPAPPHGRRAPARPLRDEGVLIVGSGFFTHNLAALRHPGGGVPGWSAEFDAWGHEALAARDVDALLDFAHASPAGRLAHPRTEHFAPSSSPWARRTRPGTWTRSGR